MANYKSLLDNPDLHLFTYKKVNTRKGKDCGVLSYKIIAIDKDDGPYICKSTNEFSIDSMYHSHNPIYSVALRSILSEKEMVPIHDCILYNKYKWSSSFKTWFESQSIRIAPRVSLNAIIFQANKYILVTWLAPESTLFAYPGYEKLVAVFGGRAIDANKIIDEHLQFIFKNDTMWYIDSGESFEIVADSNKSIIDKVYCIMEHTKKVRAIAALQAGLRAASRKLKVASYGKNFYYATNVSPLIWMDYLEGELHRFNVTTRKTGKTIRWKMGYGVADCIAKASFLAKTYSDCFGNGEVKIFVSNIKASFNSTSGRMIFKGVILKSTDKGTFGLTSLPKDCKEEFWISLMDISSGLRLFIIDYLSKKDLSICKNVCAELAVECLEKLTG